MKIYNTSTRTIETFRPLAADRVNLYACGLTVYSQPHIGNWVAYIYWDVLVRTLRASGYHVKHIQNITDVGHLVSDEDSGEDKMEKGARAEKLTAWDIAEKYIVVADMEAYQQLGLTRPTEMPRATDFIPQQIAFVEALEAEGFTYLIPGDGVYFDTSKLADYGKLARLDIAGLQAGARVEHHDKRNVTDFALWKLTPQDQVRDMQWNSPWGIGFPGWHLECSVMARELLGDRIDIHTGGIDHIPVHHTNEIAQTEALTGDIMSNYWMHCNHMQVNGTKMSKSLGNVFTISDILERGFDLQAFKLLVLGKHYRTEGNFTWENLQAAQNRLMGILEVAELLHQTSVAAKQLPEGLIANTAHHFQTALEHDIDTVTAFAAVNQLCTEIMANDVMIHPDDSATLLQFFAMVADYTGIQLIDTFTPGTEQQALLDMRQAAKVAKDWALADSTRDALLASGLQVLDTRLGQVWHRTPKTSA